MNCPTTKMICDLRQIVSMPYYHPATNGFIPQDEEFGVEERGPTYTDRLAASLLENLTRYLSHSGGCAANDLDYLDDTPCTCGLRNFYNPKATAAKEQP